MRLKKYILLLSISILFAIASYGQINRGYEDWFIGGNIGTTSLWGDVTDNENHFLPGGPFQNGFYEDRKMMWGVTAGKNISPKYAIRAQFLFGKVKSESYVEKMFMNSTVQDYTVSLAVDFVDLFDWATKSNWDVYGMVGLGVTRFRSLLNSQISNDSVYQPVVNYAPNDSNKYFRNNYSGTISIPFGVGVNYKIGKSLVISAESSIRYLNTDWLDALVSSKRAFEGFGFLSVSVLYRFDMPRGGSVWSRKSNHAFDSQRDNTGSSYRNRRRNGSIASDPFGNRTNKKSSIKSSGNRKRKTFRTPKK